MGWGPGGYYRKATTFNKQLSTFNSTVGACIGLQTRKPVRTRINTGFFETPSRKVGRKAP